MSAASVQHDLHVGPHCDTWEAIDLPGGGCVQMAVDADRKGAGPYVAASALLHRIAAADEAGMRALDPAHCLTVLAVAPDLMPRLSVSKALAASLVVSREGNARTWTMRLAQGLTDIVLGHFARASPDRGAVAFMNVEAADPLDQEFIAVLLRRADPRRLRVRVFARVERFDAALSEAIGEYARPIQISAARERQPSPAPERADEDAEAEAEAEALLAAAGDCMKMAYYDAALDYAQRGLRAVEPAGQGEAHAQLTRHTIFANLLLGRFDEVERICRALRPGVDDPALLAHATYAMAILNARLYDRSRHDYEAAKTWIEQSLAFTQALPVSQVRAVNIAFLRNTMALVEMRKGRLGAALRLLNSALRYLAREAPGLRRTESAILLHNRARLRAMMKRPDAAIADLTTLLRRVPSDSDAYLDRGQLHQQAGRHDAALADYAAAIDWSPPFDAPHFNRAQALTAVGRPDTAEQDYDRVLELSPHHLEARINRACLRYARGDHAGALADADAALARASDNARALCLRGLTLQASGDLAAAHQSYTAAISADPRLADARANRATIAFRRGDSAAALDDLSVAISLREDPIILCNRARVFENEQRWLEAERDYSRAWKIAPELDGLAARLRTCRAHLE